MTKTPKFKHRQANGSFWGNFGHFKGSAEKNVVLTYKELLNQDIAGPPQDVRLARLDFAK